MKKILAISSPVTMSVLMVTAAFVYVTCSVRSDTYYIMVQDLSELGQIDISDLTPTEVRRLNEVLNTEASPCGDGQSLAQALLNPNNCPLVIQASEYILTLLKQDYSEEEVGKRYLERYSTHEGQSIPLGESPRMGALRPVISVVVFSDFKCPHCARAADAMDRLVTMYPDHIEIVFKHFPIESIHPEATLGARAGYAAMRQDRFWDMHDLLFARGQTGFNPETIHTMAVGLGLDVDKFETDMVSDDAIRAIDTDLEIGRKLGVNGTPAVFINGRKFEGPIHSLDDRISEEFMRLQFMP